MGIDKIGLGIVGDVPRILRSDPVRYLAQENRRREYQSNVATASARAETERIKAESIRRSDVYKVSYQGRNKPSPNVNYTKGAVWENSNYYRASKGQIFSKYA